ncbi:copper chaperone PCu(A)C [Photobacterium sp. DNB23_23_1]|uniref:Copper chaperone PCu(A)C n=1 Tax=Photobacterium pectinilyticum TaxID=2906793 RepID=A0ABT1N7G1_9GAMM|nr:copper chaperone PCu(A)C [Photobacterium sp. ZSDE20]MCQ1059169.1 copper chaperone PCu(A)C [Photobacterium sp. ZSDE20]MDD1824821.1 copper chaperone PCu(A)C [Photobacterium sp. ZSDE20]
MKTIKSILLGSLFALTSSAYAHEYKAGDLYIDHPWSKQVPPTSQVAAAFFNIMNHSNNGDELISASSPIAGKTELHAHMHEDGMMKMREVEKIDIPANDSQALKPGGYHIMFFNLKEVPQLGESFPLTLNFKHAGTVKVEVKVEEATYMPEDMKEEMMDHSKH